MTRPFECRLIVDTVLLFASLVFCVALLPFTSYHVPAKFCGRRTMDPACVCFCGCFCTGLPPCTPPASCRHGLVCWRRRSRLTCEFHQVPHTPQHHCFVFPFTASCYTPGAAAPTSPPCSVFITCPCYFGLDYQLLFGPFTPSKGGCKATKSLPSSCIFTPPYWYPFL